MSYNLVPGLESHLKHYNYVAQKENCVRRYNENSLNYKDDNLKLSRSSESNSISPFSPFSTSSSSESCQYYTANNYEQKPLQTFSLTESSENLNSTMLSDDTLVLKSSSQLTVTSESFSVSESSPKKEDEKGNQYQYFVDENLTEEEVLKHILGLHKAEITDFEKTGDIKYTVETTKVDEKEKNQQSIEISDEASVARVKNLKSTVYQEFQNQNMIEQEYVDQTSHRSRSIVNSKTRGYQREFKKSKERELQRSSSRNNVSFSRSSIHEEFKRSKSRLNSIDNSSGNERTPSYSRSNFRQEFKKGRNQSINDDYSLEPEIDEDFDSSVSSCNRTSHGINRSINKEFKRSKSRINSRKIERNYESQDTDIDESKNSLNLYESINEIDIKNRNIDSHQNQKYMQEFKKSPINFPRSEDRSVRMNRPTQGMQGRYGFDENQQPSHAYSTQSLPTIEDDQFNPLEGASQQTLSLNERGENKNFQGSVLNRVILNQIKKTKAKNGSAETKIDLEMLDKDELENLKNLLEIKTVIADEIESEMQENPVNKDIKTSKQKSVLLRQVLLELREECKQQNDRKSKIKRDDLWKKLKVCLDNDRVYIVSNDIAIRSPSPVTVLDEEDKLLVKILDLLRPMIREMVREEVKKCISELVSSS